MSQIILYHNGVFNIYSTIIDNVFYENGLTLNELENEIKEYQGTQGLKVLPDRIVRAISTGSSALGETLAETIACNHCGDNEITLSLKEFIDKYLTL